jgi:hypothetical protein
VVDGSDTAGMVHSFPALSPQEEPDQQADRPPHWHGEQDPVQDAAGRLHIVIRICERIDYGVQGSRWFSTIRAILLYKGDAFQNRSGRFECRQVCH